MPVTPCFNATITQEDSHAGLRLHIFTKRSYVCNAHQCPGFEESGSLRGVCCHRHLGESFLLLFLTKCASVKKDGKPNAVFSLSDSEFPCCKCSVMAVRSRLRGTSHTRRPQSTHTLRKLAIYRPTYSLFLPGKQQTKSAQRFQVKSTDCNMPN